MALVQIASSARCVFGFTERGGGMSPRWTCASSSRTFDASKGGVPVSKL